MNVINVLIFLSGVSASLYHSVNRGLLSKAATRLISHNGGLAAGMPLLFNRAAFSNVPENSGKRFISMTTSRSSESNEQSCLSIQRLALKNNEKYEMLLANRHFIVITQAYERNEIDYTYIPDADKFYLVLLDMKGPEGNKILQKYFEHRTFDKMCDMGVFDYKDLMVAAAKRKNYYIANLAVKNLAARANNEYYPELCDCIWVYNREYLRTTPLAVLEIFPGWRNFLDNMNRVLSENDKQTLMFFLHNVIYASVIEDAYAGRLPNSKKEPEQK